MTTFLLDTLDKITQWESIPYSAGLCCTDCGKADLGNYGNPNGVLPDIIGWCETPRGFMAVFECPECHSKFRCHCGGDEIDDIEKFDTKLWRWLCHCQNGEEIKNIVRNKF